MTEAKKDDSVLPADIARDCVSTWNVIYKRAVSSSREFLHPEFRFKYDPAGFISRVYSDAIDEKFNSLLSYAAGPQFFREYLPIEARIAGLLAPMIPSEDFPTDEEVGLGINLEQNDLGVFGEEDAKKLLLRHIIFMQPIRIEMLQRIISQQRSLRVIGSTMTFEHDPDAGADDQRSIQKALNIKRERIAKFIFGFEEYYGEPFYVPDNLALLVPVEAIAGLSRYIRQQFLMNIPDLVDYLSSLF